MLILAAANILVFALLFVSLEAGYRIYRDGFHEFVLSLMSGHSAPYSSLGTGNWIIYDPELGYRLNPAQPNINSRSIRGPEITVPKPSGVFRIVVLGDSIPMDQPGFVDELSDQLKDRGTIEVINASLRGYTSFQELTFFKRYLVDTDPDLVIWAYCLNDNHKFQHRFDEDAHMLLTDEARESLAINTWWDWVVSRSYVLTTIRVGLFGPAERRSSSIFPWETRVDFNIAWKDYSWRFYEGHLREMVELLKPRNVLLTIIIFPFEPQLALRSHQESRDYILKPQTKLAELCEKYAVPLLDLYPRFEQAYDTGAHLYRTDAMHLNWAGHHLTAAELMQFLDVHRLVPAAR
jgi:lysophospholipase L1-like esterase